MTAADRVAGSLCGLALGDAMGMPVEMFTREKILAAYGVIDGLMDGAPDNPISRGMKAGEVTDDTIMSMLTCQMLIERGGTVDARYLIDLIRAWSASDPKSRCVIGPSTRAAFEKIDAGMPLEEAGRQGVTNGASMKIAPIGAITRPTDRARLLDRVHALCMPTHNTRVAVSGAMAVAGAVSLAVEGEDNLQRIFDFALVCAQDGKTRGYDALSPDVSARMRLAWDAMPGFSCDADALQWIYDVIGTGLPVAQAVPAAFAVLRLGGGEPLRCASLSASMGGDTDTIGAMACAMAGAMRGMDSIPEGIRSQLERSGGFDFRGTAEQLALLRSCTESGR